MRTQLLISFSLITVLCGPHTIAAEMPSVQPKPIALKAFAGGAVIVVCSSAIPQGVKEMAFCRDDELGCISDKTPHKSSSRLFLHKVKGPPKVLMTQLNVSDSGVYYCGGKSSHKAYKNTTFLLEVKVDPLFGQCIEIIGHLGESINISCQYPEVNRDTFKYLYRQFNVSVWTQLASSDQRSESKSDRYVAADTKEGRLFNVTITRLAPDDAGIYWCGVGTGKATGSRNLMTKVKLTVIGHTHQKIAATTASACTTSCLRVETPAYTTTQPKRITSGSAALHHTITVTSLTLLCLLAGLAALLLLICRKRRKATRRPTSSPNGQPNDRSQNSRKDQIYEEIKDTSSVPNPAESSSSSISSPPESVYSLAQLPSQPSEDPGYSTVNFHRHSKETDDSTGTVMGAVSTDYATIKLHT